jgi:hypothetical protein
MKRRLGARSGAMSRYRFELATPADDAELRSILAATPMDGEIAVAFRREPSFFAAAAVEGPFHQTIVGRDREEGCIVGFGSRSVRMRYVNGEPMPIGYLSALRVLPHYRSLGLIARGYAHFRRLHEDERTKLYLTTIAEGNEQARAILTSGRAGLPKYHDAGRYVTAVVPPRARRQRSHRSIEVRPAENSDIAGVLTFLRDQGKSQQFFPEYDADDLFGPQATFRSLRLADIALAFSGGELAGVLAAWDQRATRQTVVQGYSRRLHLFRPWYNALAHLRNRPLLPRPGEAFPFITGALPVVRDNDSEAMSALIDYHASASSQRPFLLIGLHERDPLLPALRRRRLTEYVTRLYHVCWDDGEALRASLDSRPPYLELGCL